jgi:hypothetical protein
MWKQAAAQTPQRLSGDDAGSKGKSHLATQARLAEDGSDVDKEKPAPACASAGFSIQAILTSAPADHDP